jgi:GNAT superfamily N-acetyltransferase
VGEREVRTDPSGRPVLSFVRGVRDGRPWADLVQVLGPGATELVLTQLPGWVVSGPEPLARDLLARGARPRRHAHTYSFDLGQPLPAAWASPVLPAGLRVTPCDREPEDLVAAWRAAYTPGHPDHHDPGSTADVVDQELRPLMDGSALGPLLPCSGLVVDEAACPPDAAGTGAGLEPVVAAVLVNGQDSDPPLGGPWVAEVFRDPAPRYAGLGTVLLRRALALAAADGLPALGLAVTEGNPARRLYERIGFRHTDTAMTVVVPG